MKQEGNKNSKKFIYMYGNYVVCVQLLELSLLGIGTVLRFVRAAWSMVKFLRGASNK